MPRYLFVRRDGWTRYHDAPADVRTWLLAEPVEPRVSTDIPLCEMHSDCLQNTELARECSRSRMVSPRSAHVFQRMFVRHEFHGTPWDDRERRDRRTFIFLEDTLRPEEFMDRWRDFPT